MTGYALIITKVVTSVPYQSGICELFLVFLNIVFLESPCLEFEFDCGSNTTYWPRCVSERFVFNNLRDCFNGTDEQPEICEDYEGMCHVCKLVFLNTYGSQGGGLQKIVRGCSK